MHKGIDIAESGVHGAVVRAADGGVVMVAGDLNDGYGNYVIVTMATVIGPFTATAARFM